MKPEAADYLEKARESLDEARAIYGIGLASVAARSAYYAAFHAAQALIFSQSGKVAKTHGGVRSEFNRLAKDNEHISPELRAFLAKAYAYKEMTIMAWRKSQPSRWPWRRAPSISQKDLLTVSRGLSPANNP
jgi:uncharacterized protein (UPF0332 family)